MQSCEILVKFCWAVIYFETVFKDIFGEKTKKNKSTTC